MPNHNIAVIGAGPIGSLMAAYLARNQENIYLIDIKKELISAIEQNGITVTGVADNFNTRVKATGYSIANLNEFDIDLFFIATKFNFLDFLLDDIKPIFKSGQKILLIQNGIDNEDKAAEKFSPEDILRFVINYAGSIVEPGIIKFAFFNPPNYIGALSAGNEPLAREIADFITEAGLETAFSPDIKKYEWKKTILNASLMPVCAATGLTMKQAMDTEETRFLCEQILKESIQVAKKVGHEYGEDFFENCIGYLSKAGDHKPSTSIDLEAGNPIEYVFQAIIDYGKEIGSPTPYLESLTKVIRTLEKQKRKAKS
ncbi:MAG: ketopantoate reductase family protein [Candidatus Aminicenantes bacterium]|nr:MAG: ketopantoate reductase family protein [Candidatus Aminicenantes bacterium]